jgi:hypothetical protein
VKKAGREWYRHPVTGLLYPSVTSILTVLNKGDGMIQSAANETVRAMFERRALIPHLNDVDEALRQFKYAYKATWQRKAHLGSSVHTYVEALIADEPLPPVPPEHEPYMEGFLDFHGKLEPHYIAWEATVFNETIGYAGTFDFLWGLGDFTILTDTKTGKGVYGETALQLAALRYAEEIWSNPTATLMPMPPIHETTALWLRPGRHQLKHVTSDAQAFEAFCGLVKALPWVKEREDSAIGVTYSRASLLRALEVSEPAQPLIQPSLEVVKP